MLPWSVRASAYMPVFMALFTKSGTFDIPSSTE